MKPTNGSNDSYLRLIAIFIALVLAGLFLPSEVLSSNELFLLWIVMLFVGWLWIQTDADAAKGS